MTHLTTHVLDASTGRPAAGVAVELRWAAPAASAAPGAPDGASAALASGATDADGRLALGPYALEPGDYVLHFATGAYFAASGTPAFYPHVDVAFTVAPEAGHLHVPLLLSPFAYSTYRGS